MTEFRELELPGAFEIIPKQFGDERGFFSETYNQSAFHDAGIKVDFVQDNHSFSSSKGVLRGMHFQMDPFGQDKLVRVTRGRVLDVIVDLRLGSPTYKEHVTVELSAEKWNQLFVPKGFAHGFLTLEENTEFLYKVTAFYSQQHDCSIRFDDPELGIDWGIDPNSVELSQKDKNGLMISEIDPGFKFKG